MNADATRTIYLDHAAATPLDPEVLAAMQPYLGGQFYNPSAGYAAGQKVGAAVDRARDSVAAQLGVRSLAIVFTAGGTEANNLAIHGVMQQFAGKHCVVSAVEHDSVLMPAKRYRHNLAPVSPDGRIDVDRLGRLITDDTVLVSVMYANNEIGTIQPLKRVVELVAAVRSRRAEAGNTLPLYVHTDACQAANYLDLHIARLGVDMLTLNGGKVYGPKQSGALYVGQHVQLAPQVLGGGQERGRRSGTENVAGSIGFAAALERAQSLRHSESRRLHELQAAFVRDIQQAIPSVRLNGSLKYRLPNNLHITLPGSDNERLMMQLDQQGIMVAQGSACSASSQEPSHVLGAIGLSDADARASLRLSMGRSTQASDMHAVLTALRDLTLDA